LRGDSSERFPSASSVRWAYDSDRLDASLAELGIEMIAPHHPRRRRKTQDGRPRRRYRRRGLVERRFSWRLGLRRLVTRYAQRAANFLGMRQLACAVILLRHL
jgi:transposase